MTSHSSVWWWHHFRLSPAAPLSSLCFPRFLPCRQQDSYTQRCLHFSTLILPNWVLQVEWAMGKAQELFVADVLNCHCLWRLWDMWGEFTPGAEWWDLQFWKVCWRNGSWNTPAFQRGWTGVGRAPQRLLKLARLMEKHRRTLLKLCKW